ncbi:flavin-containing monooxygenase [Mycetocola zhadangensis]|uniref:Potassium transporter Trk n=1 Tax=Mycetocola zhadangensis TaxID=1164595 RepID=A0A3L7J5L9_9MICO|nr:NAD(P)/FAD-dependent oxidoreductase [Mycetocola zhadangensis]RLQ86018.1 potassium transporter Trk [Mycetocola zhadangensis]GGE87674.1 oxidoreductase [Mycetocola zhadangensis]
MEPSTIIIGAGQAGLAVAHELEERSVSCVVVDRAEAIGDPWRERWDSLRLFTPAVHDGLPGLPFPAPPASLPSKDEFADYLNVYAGTLSAPVHLSTSVTRVTNAGDRYLVQTSSGLMEADSVVLATGTHPLPHVPAFATDIAADIRQLHSSGYSKPDDLPSGTVLVVGSGTSGLQIALDLARSHDVTVAGRPTPHIPDAIFRFAGAAYWALVSHLLTTATPVGRKVAATFHDRGAPLISVSPGDIDRAGIMRVARITGTDAGRPVTQDGDVLTPRSIVWATGYRPNLDWVDGLPLDAHGWPISIRGVVDAVPGLYTVGFPFQFGLTSGLIGGVGRDAAHVAGAIQSRVYPPEAIRSDTPTGGTKSDERTGS